MTKQATKWRVGAFVAALLALGAAASEAVVVNPDGLGQVLLFPYYSARMVGGSANATIISLSNPTSQAKALGVSFFEGKAGKQVLGFNLFLAPAQTWVATVGLAPSGGAQIYTDSITCTAPDLSPQPPPGPGLPPPPSPSRLSRGVAVPFRSLVYSGDGLGDGLDRTLEGYVQVIEMATYPANTQTAIKVTPIDGVASCAVSDALALADQRSPTGQLMGYAEIINPLQGNVFAVEPTALDSFNNSAFYQTSGSLSPQLTNALPLATWTSGTQVISAIFSTGADAVSAVLMHDSVLNQFAIDTASTSGADWVLTFPTKSFYVNGRFPTRPFQRTLTPFGSCDDIDVFPPESIVVPPSSSIPPVVPSLCWWSNVVTLSSTDLLGSADLLRLTVPPQVTDDWARFTFSQTAVAAGVHKLTSLSATVITPSGAQSVVSGVTFSGLPVIGFAVRRSNNASLTEGNPVSRAIGTAAARHKFTDVVSVVP